MIKLKKNSFIIKNYFEISNNLIPYFRLVVILVFIAIAVFTNFINVSFIGNVIFLSLYLTYALVLIFFVRLRKFVAFKLPFLLTCTDMLLLSYAITITGGAESSPIYLFFILFIAYYAIVHNIRFTVIVTCICSVYYLGTAFLSGEQFTLNIFIKTLYFYVFALFTGIISDKLNMFSLTLATQDHLTLLYNRQYLSSTLEDLLHQSIRCDTQMSLIIFDVDNFKLINDNEGHLEGDNVLIKTADIIKHVIRTEDIAARYGGDEFIIVLPNTDKTGAINISARIKAAFESQFCDKIGISAGVATFPEDGRTVNELFRNADDAMYREKGSNKFIPAE